METALTHQPDAACPQCEQHLDEIARLQAELAELRGKRGPRRTGRWWGLAALGVFFLTVFVHVPAIIFATIDVGRGWSFYLLLGSSLGLTWALWSLIAIFCMLHEGAVWRRAVMYVSLCGIATVTTLFRVYVFGVGDEVMFYMTHAGVLLTVVMAVPVFLARVLRRWTVTQRSSTAQPQPMSVATYLTVMTVCGVMITAMKFFPWNKFPAGLESTVTYLVVLGGSLIAVGCLHWWMLPTMLGPRDGRSISRKQWLLLGSIFAVGSAPSIVGLALLHANLSIVSWVILAQVAAHTLVLTVSAAGFIAAGYLWLRLLDYELRTA